ncbi:hypothetical protein ACOME3_009610 [Neoechinorhynchus agilis]
MSKDTGSDETISKVGTSASILVEIDLINQRSKSLLRRLSSPLVTFSRSIEALDESELAGLINALPDRITLWNHVLGNWDEYGRRRSNVFKEAIYGGIEDSVRGEVWLQMSTTDHSVDIRREFRENRWLPSDDEIIISRDISRTFPRVSMFAEVNSHGQRDLFNLLKVYSLHDSTTGYCQGMSFIGAILLMKMKLNDAYVTLVYLMDVLEMKLLYAKDMISLQCVIFQFSELLEEHCPALLSHFRSVEFDLSLFCCYFLTLFATVFPLDVVLRIMDILLLEGIHFIFKIGLSLLQMHQHELITMDMENIQTFLTEGLKVTDVIYVQYLIDSTRSIAIDRKSMKRSEKNFKKKFQVHQQQEDINLKIENKALRAMVNKLETESAVIAKRLLDTQVRFTEREYVYESIQDRSHPHDSLRSSVDTLSEVVNIQSDQIDMERYVNEKNSVMLKSYRETLDTLQSELKTHIVSCHLKQGNVSNVEADEKLIQLLRISSLEAEVEKQEFKKCIKQLKTRIEFLQATATTSDKKIKDLLSAICKKTVEIEHEKRLNRQYKRKIEDLEFEISEIKAKSKMDHAQGIVTITALRQRISQLELDSVTVDHIIGANSDDIEYIEKQEKFDDHVQFR